MLSVKSGAIPRKLRYNLSVGHPTQCRSTVSMHEDSKFAMRPSTSLHGTFEASSYCDASECFERRRSGGTIAFLTNEGVVVGQLFSMNAAVDETTGVNRCPEKWRALLEVSRIIVSHENLTELLHDLAG